MSEEQLKAATGVPAAWGERAFTIRERVSARPTLEINGLWSGWAGPGPKTIIPAKAMAKVSCRLVGNQDPHKIYEQLKEYIESLAPPTVKVDVDLLTTGEPALIDFNLPEMQAAARAYEKGWGATPVFTRGGGSIPIVADIYDSDEDTGGDDGLRAGHRRPARDQRALQHRDVPARHRDGDRLPGRAGAAAALIWHGITPRHRSSGQIRQHRATQAADDVAHVSTGRLPIPERVRALLYAAHERFAANDEGQNSDVYPALAAVPRDLFGICVAAADGAIYAVGDAEYPFTIMSVSKPFVFALVCQALGAEKVRRETRREWHRVAVQLGRWRSS